MTAPVLDIPSRRHQMSAEEWQTRVDLAAAYRLVALFKWDDLVRGDITFQTEHVPDFAVARANGQPLYTLVNPVDDALMHITHVLRGEDLL